ncbi:MAG: hypothetical protein CVV59_02230 [Tenericutes bacterium HGW-Tenericutes-4]|jgi:glutamate-1-semialdehyde aminotransferase|nr:MAG: hypothetical protein CVV59_02230 [Tenericutes bacterium HGW-Tenericutes-4]
MENKKEITVVKKEDGTTLTIEKSGDVTTTVVTDKDGKQISFQIMMVGHGKAHITDKITKEILVGEFFKEKTQTEQKIKPTGIENIENLITVLPSEKSVKHTKKHFKKHKSKRTKQNLFYKGDDEKTF